MKNRNIILSYCVFFCNFFSYSVLLKVEKQDDVQTKDGQNAVDDHQSFFTADIDAIIGRTYTTVRRRFYPN
jgi:hypothetical protein